MINDRDIKDVALYIGLSSHAKGLSISPLKLQKLLYYFQSWFMACFGRDNTLFPEVPQAWVNGPVYESIFHIYKTKAENMCDHLPLSAFGSSDVLEDLSSVCGRLALEADQIELLESVLMLYGRQTQNELIWLTHSEAPWVEARGSLPPYAKSANPLSLDTMYTFYKERFQRNRERREARI